MVIYGMRNGKGHYFGDDWIDINEPFANVPDGYEITLKPGRDAYKVFVSTEQMALLVKGSHDNLRISLRRAEADELHSKENGLIQWLEKD